MAIVRFDPFRDLVAMQDRVGRILGDYYGGPAGDEVTRGAWVPPVDIFDNSNHELVIKAELPDMRREDIDITVENGTLVLRGEKKIESSVEQESFHRIERTYGTFNRSFTLPNTVDATKVSADYKNGVLTVKLPFPWPSKTDTVPSPTFPTAMSRWPLPKSPMTGASGNKPTV